MIAVISILASFLVISIFLNVIAFKQVNKWSKFIFDIEDIFNDVENVFAAQGTVFDESIKLMDEVLKLPVASEDPMILEIVKAINNCKTSVLMARDDAREILSRLENRSQKE